MYTIFSNYIITVMYCSTPCLYSFRFVKTATP